MGRACTVCIHPSSTAIDSDLLDGFSGNSIAEEFGVSPDAIKRHRREHLLSGLRPVPPRSTDFDGTRYSQRNPNSEQSKVLQIQSDAVWASGVGRPEPEIEPQTTTSQQPTEPPFEGIYRGMGQIKTVNFIVCRLMEEADAAKSRGDLRLAIAAIAKAGDLVLKLMKIAPDGEELNKPAPEPDAQEELKALIREACKPHFVPDGWVVSKPNCGSTT